MEQVETWRAGGGYFWKTCIIAASLRLGHLRQGLLHERAIFNVAGLQHLVEAEGGVAEQDLGILEALVVVGEGEMDLLRDTAGCA